MKLQVVVHPNSRKPRIDTDLFGTLHVYVAEPPLEGKANAAVGVALAKHFKVTKSSVVLMKGEKSKIKIFQVGD
jgi:uncharacterized protein